MRNSRILARLRLVEKSRKSTESAHHATVDALTATESKILKLIVEGKANATVAALLGLSPRTVEAYRARLMRKLGVDNLPALVKYAIRHGITTLD